MIAKEGIWEALRDVFAKAFTKSNSEWFEKTLGIKPDKFFEHVAIETIAVLSATAIIAFIGFVGSRHIWRAIRRRFRAATIRKTSSAAFVIVRCPIANDSNEAIGNEIAARLETAFRAFAGWGETGGRPFHVMEFPLALSGDEGTKAYDRAIETAKRWLEKTDGDILIWGKRVKGESVGIVRLIGKDRKRGVIEVRRVDFDKRATDFDQALANAIAYEAARLTQVTLSEPELVNLETLREVSNKLKRLASNEAPALSTKWRERMAAEHWRLTEEIVHRTPSPEEREGFETAARIEIAGLDPVKQPLRFAVTALRIVILIRKRNWIDPNPDELKEARVLVDEAIPALKSVRANREWAEAAVERLAIRRQQLLFAKKAHAEEFANYLIDFQEADRLVKLANDERLNARLIAASCVFPAVRKLTDVLVSDTDGPAALFAFIDRLSPHLDNEELLDLSEVLRFWTIDRGDHTMNVEFWHAGPQLLEKSLNSRSSWTRDERLLLTSMISFAMFSTGYRIDIKLGGDEGIPYFNTANRLVSKVIDSFDWRQFVPRRYIELRIFSFSGISVHHLPRDSQLIEKALQALRAVVGPSSAKFQRLQRGAIGALISTLNNCASAFLSLEAAKEALQHALNLNQQLELEDEIDSADEYVAAFSAWQVARLTPRDDVAGRAEWSRKAHGIAEQALQRAMDDGNQLHATDVDVVLRELEADFPELAPELDKAVVAADEETKRVAATSTKLSSGGQKD